MAGLFFSQKAGLFNTSSLIFLFCLAKLIFETIFTLSNAKIAYFIFRVALILYINSINNRQNTKLVLKRQQFKTSRISSGVQKVKTSPSSLCILVLAVIKAVTSLIKQIKLLVNKPHFYFIKNFVLRDQVWTSGQGWSTFAGGHWQTLVYFNVLKVEILVDGNQ